MTWTSIFQEFPVEIGVLILGYVNIAHTFWHRRFINDVLPDIKKKRDGGRWAVWFIYPDGRVQICANCYSYGDGTGSGFNAFCSGSSCQVQDYQQDVPENERLYCYVGYTTFNMYKADSRHSDDPNWTLDLHRQHLESRGWDTGSHKHSHRLALASCLREIERRFEFGQGTFLFDTAQYHQILNAWMWDLVDENEVEDEEDALWINPEPLPLLN